MLAAAMGLRDSPRPYPLVSRADAAAHSLRAHWIFSIHLSPGSLRSRVEDEGFTVVRRRACPAYLLGNRDDACVGGDDDSERDGCSECNGCCCGEGSAASHEERRTRICKRRR